MHKKSCASSIIIRNPIRIAKLLFYSMFLTLVLTIPFILKQKPQSKLYLMEEALNNLQRDIRYANVYRKPSRMPEDLKFILLWTSADYSPFYFFGNGQKVFIDYNCSSINCYVTTDRRIFGGSLKRFDAIAFNGRNLKYIRPAQLPRERYDHQKYIYVNIESADYYPVCESMYEGFFNWTATYKLDSDIPFPYIITKNKFGDTVGPRKDMRWEVPYVDEELPSRLRNKSKAVAWFVSNCSSRSRRQIFVDELKKELSVHGLSVDVYGGCGDLKCPLHEASICNSMLERDYYFYLALENSFDEDYVTEKLLTALQNNVVPIVYGAANYFRFLPPSSYLDARSRSTKNLAATIARLIRSPRQYRKFFRWKKQYTYHSAKEHYACALCAALNNRDAFKNYTAYKDFRKWWNPRYEDRCGWATLKQL